VREDIEYVICLKLKEKCINGSDSYSIPTWGHLNPQELRSSKVWAEVVVEVSVWVVREGIFYQLTGA
jgi:hypothetical protein|tara:strand:+ start:346 stop:546 length:201 start_codon:yes stop_codon:yes gene_type:complete